MDTAHAGLAIGRERSVNEVIRTHPETVAVFDRFGIDACCGGTAGVAEAAVRDGADPEALLAALNGLVGRPE